VCVCERESVRVKVLKEFVRVCEGPRLPDILVAWRRPTTFTLLSSNGPLTNRLLTFKVCPLTSTMVTGSSVGTGRCTVGGVHS